MLTNDDKIVQVDKWLRGLSSDWRSIHVEVSSTEGIALYQLVCRGLAEVVCRFVAWSPESNFEVWFDGTILGHSPKSDIPLMIKDQFPQGQSPRVFRHVYTAARMAPVMSFAVPDEELKKTICTGKPFVLSGELALRLRPIERAIVLAETYRCVRRIAACYQQIPLENGTCKPMPIGSKALALMVQGVSTAESAVICNIAELEPRNVVRERFSSCSAIAFAFTQAYCDCSEVMCEYFERGRNGEIPEKDEDLDHRLGDACAQLYYVGRYVIAMYQRNGRDPTYVAAMIANPLSIRNIDYGLISEIKTIAAMDSTRRVLPELPNLYSAHLSIDGGNSEKHLPNNPEHMRILQMIRHMGRAFETTPDTYTKFTEEELRNHILTYLQGQFTDRVSAEHFRKQGRTDLCIKLANDEAFIAECKIWEGACQCIKALDQIMSYITTRDRIGALIFFNKNVRDFTKNVIKTSEEVIRTNELFLAQHKMEDFGEHHFEVCHKDDSARRYHLYVLLFNLYPNTRKSSRKISKTAQ